MSSRVPLVDISHQHHAQNVPQAGLKLGHAPYNIPSSAVGGGVFASSAAAAHAPLPTEADLFHSVIERLIYEAVNGHTLIDNHLMYQTEVNDKMRAILVDWLVDVHLKYKCRPQTLYLAISVLDRYLMKQPVEKKKLQLVGCVAMMLACKFEEITPPEVREFVHISANTYTRSSMLEMERDVLTKLDYDLVVPTLWQFLTHLTQMERESVVRHGAEYLAEQTLMCAKMVGFNPLAQAAACVFLARKVLQLEPWTQELSQESRLSDVELADVVSALDEYIKKAHRLKICAVRKKYSHSRYSSISRTFDEYAMSSAAHAAQAAA